MLTEYLLSLNVSVESIGGGSQGRDQATVLPVGLGAPIWAGFLQTKLLSGAGFLVPMCYESGSLAMPSILLRFIVRERVSYCSKVIVTRPPIILGSS